MTAENGFHSQQEDSDEEMLSPKVLTWYEEYVNFFDLEEKRQICSLFIADTLNLLSDELVECEGPHQAQAIMETFMRFTVAGEQLEQILFDCEDSVE